MWFRCLTYLTPTRLKLAKQAFCLGENNSMHVIMLVQLDSSEMNSPNNSILSSTVQLNY